MTRKGFTLIELLVVVLIIGILSAVALPQYQVAVEKSRLGTVMSNVKTIKNAAEVHYLAAGEYGDDITVFDIGEISGCRSAGSAQLHCSNSWYDWLIYGGGNNLASAGYTRPYGEFKTGYVQFGDYSQTPGVAECWAKADDSVANQVCKSMGGVASRTQSCPPSGPSCQIYRLP
ncbi:MAG: prepilin-type N-terminal cleavage/methylation domain-containing protein [Elusimicrobiaceae bacterium]|nr:prepilin-type N-terminal cleavage/methylation domain-containing protein [Elusimicrobiaceae bacterium]